MHSHVVSICHGRDVCKFAVLPKLTSTQFLELMANLIHPIETLLVHHATHAIHVHIHIHVHVAHGIHVVASPTVGPGDSHSPLLLLHVHVVRIVE